MSYGQFIKDRRIALGLSLRTFCEQQPCDPGNHSKLERGILNPPDDKAFMDKLAKALHIERGTGDWFEFHTLANIARQQIPKVLMDDAEVVEKLPVLFRTLSGESLPEEKMDELIDFIRTRQ